MKFFRVCYILILFQLNIFAFSDLEIAKAIRKIAKEQNIDEKILYTIVQIESDFEPFAICMTTSKINALEFMKIKDPLIKIVASQYKYNKNKWALSFYPKTVSLAKALARAFKKQKFSFDVGLTQINTNNFSFDEIDLIFQPYYSLKKSAFVLKECQKIKKDLKSTIECYNYGTGRRNSFPYFKRFLTSYKNSFGE